MSRRLDRDAAPLPGGALTRALFAAVLALALGALTGCSKEPSLMVKAPKTVNGGRPVYMSGRAVEQPKFAADSYGSVVARVAAPDDSVVMTQVIYPGTQP